MVIHDSGKTKSKVHLYSVTTATYTASVELSSQTGPAYSLGRSQARGHGFWPAAIYGPSLYLCSPRLDYYSFTDPKEMDS